MDRWVEVTFDCLPLRSVGRLDVPIDASPKYRERCQKIKQIIDQHGSHNVYFLYNAKCTYRLTNRESLGMIQFRFEGAVLTDSDDLRTERCELQVDLLRETCDWLSRPIVEWFRETVPRTVAVEFDRYIEAGDLEQTRERLRKIQAASDDADGFVGMHL